MAAPQPRGKSILIGCAALAAAVLLLGVFAVMQGKRKMDAFLCTGNVSALASSLTMYAANYHAYPAADKWCEAVTEFTRTRAYLKCPARPDLECGYAFNAALAGMRPEDTKSNPDDTVVVFESDRGWNAAGGIELLPEKPRHDGADVYGFVGGVPTTHFEHAASVPREAVVSGKTSLVWDPTEGTRKPSGRGKPLPSGARGEAGSDLPANE